jgi:RNA polymerase sigma-70 factor, ECF subfamily
MLRRGGTLAATGTATATAPVAGAPEAPEERATVAGAPQARGVPEAPGGLARVPRSPADVTVLDALVARAQAGDRAAFEQLVERRLDRAFRTARAIMGNDADARDATQEAFLRAWRERRRLRDPGRFDAWLGRILVNSCREILRGRRRRAVREIAASDLLDPVGSVPARGPGPDERTASIDTLERAFERLRVDERAILVLHHLERRPLTEIAATLEIPVGTVKSRLHAARHSLERALEAELR